jgi:hypothetical protein
MSRPLHVELHAERAQAFAPGASSGLHQADPSAA